MKKFYVSFLNAYNSKTNNYRHLKFCLGAIPGLETNARPLARGELNSVRASGSSDLTSPVGEWTFYGDLSTMN